jgi:hypothetical protein
VKVLSLRANSMPEERTVSKFTKLTPAERSQMTLPTMLATTTVAQYYKTKDKVHRKATRKPAVKYRDVKDTWTASHSIPESEASRAALDEEDDSWLDERQDEEVQDHIALDMSPRSARPWARFINLSSHRITEMLSDSCKTTVKRRSAMTALSAEADNESDWGSESEDEGAGGILQRN